MSDTITGTTIAGRYHVTGLYRPGRMGDTYLARRIEDDALVFVKLLDPAYFDQQERVRRFERELRITRSIQHPATLSVLDAGRDEHGPFLVTEYVQGESLADILAEHGALSADRAARLAARIASALHAAHNVGVIHRDLAPTNVLVGHDDLIKVTDFGLSVLTQLDNSGADEVTATGVKIGTPWYMAPEYITEEKLDARADLYGLGVVLFEMLTGSKPYTGRPYEVMDLHVDAPIPHPQAKAGNTPGWLDALTVQLMAKEPGLRPPSAIDVIRRIEEGLGGAVVAGPSPMTPLGAGRVAEPPPRIRRLIGSHLRQGAKQVAASLERRRSYVVQRLANPSVAAELGWRPGWRIVLPDEPVDGLLEPEFSAEVNQRRFFAFPPGQTTQAVEGVTSGADPGATLMRAPENVEAYFNPEEPSAEALHDLWIQSRYELLERLCQATLEGGSSDPAALVLKGAAQYEQGRQGEGLRWIQQFHDRHAASAPAPYRAVAHFYLGLDRLQFGHRPSAAEHFRHATVLGGLLSAAGRHEELTGSRPDVTPWVGRTFAPATLPRQDTGAPVDVVARCEPLGPDQLLAVVFAGGQERTADHGRTLRRLHRHLRGFPSVLPEALVVTAIHDGDPEPPLHPADEALRATDRAITWLVDPAAQWHRAIHPANLPCVYLLDAQATCRYQGPLSGVGLWEALAAS
ncbi:MAG: serine/threonine-protein kinase [Myxococcota bacterium]